MTLDTDARFGIAYNYIHTPLYTNRTSMYLTLHTHGLTKSQWLWTNVLFNTANVFAEARSANALHSQRTFWYLAHKSRREGMLRFTKPAMFVYRRMAKSWNGIENCFVLIHTVLWGRAFLVPRQVMTQKPAVRPLRDGIVKNKAPISNVEENFMWEAGRSVYGLSQTPWCYLERE